MATEPTPTDAAMDPCGDCGMPCAQGEYHPYAACLMFKACHNSETVRANLNAVRAQPAPAASQVPLTDEQLYNEKQTAIPQLFDLARQWADNQIHSYQFSHEAEKIVDAVARRVEAAHGIKET